MGAKASTTDRQADEKPKTGHRRHSDAPSARPKLAESDKFARRSSSVKRDDLNELRLAFFKDYPSGAITPAQFRRDWASADVFRGSAPSFTDHLFRSFDTKNDGLLDFDEYASALRVLQGENRREKESWVFRLFDADGDGILSRGEMEEVVMAASPPRKKRNTSTVQIRISPPGSPTSMDHEHGNAAAQVMAIFDEIDANRDGQITKREFMCALNDDPHILKELVGHYKFLS